MPQPETLLLPSGAVTRTRVTWPALAATLRSTNIAYVLARALEVHLPDLRLLEPTIAYWSSVPEEVAVALQSALSTPVRPHRLLPEASSYRRGGFSPFYPGQTVVLVVDTLLTGKTASSLVGALRRMDARPVAVAALLDGRLDCGSPVQTFAASVPVVSCLERTIVLGYRPDRLIPVDREGQPEADGYLQTSYKVSSETFAGWLRDADEPELLVGHIERGPQRHFTTYLNVPHLVGQHLPALTEAVLELLSVSDSALVQLERSHRVKIFVPNSFAQQLGTVLQAAIRDKYGCDVEVITARRRESGAWHVATPHLQAGFLAVLLDWGAVTATTIRGLASFVAGLGAATVQAIAVTSQLDRESEDAVCTTSALRARTLETPTDLFDSAGPAVERDVPVRFDFLTSARMGLAAASECQLCDVARMVRSHAANAPSRLLREHAAMKYELFRPITRDEAFASIITDLVGSELAPADAYEIWLLRQRFERCTESTSAREELSSYLLSTDVVSEPRRWSALIRLLIVEPYWLKLAPVDRRPLRKHIAEQAVRMLQSDSTSVREFTVGLRWQAAMVIRSASKGLFLEIFAAEVLRAVASDLRIATELCYGMFTLIDAPYHHETRVMTNVITAISDTLDKLSDRLAGDEALRPIYQTLRSLYGIAITVQSGLRMSGDIISTWHSLRDQYVEPLKTHAGALTSMLVVQGGLSGPALAQRARAGDHPDSSYWRARAQAWDECRAFLEANVFPYLTRLREQIGGSVDIPTSGLATLFELNSQRAAAFAEDLGALVEKPAVFDQITQQRLAAEASAWFTELLSGPHDRDGSGATLFRLLQESPTPVNEAWAAALERSREAGWRIRRVEAQIEPLVVFLDRGLLINVLVQIIENASIPKHATDDRPPTGVALRVEGGRESNGTIVVRVLNDTSKPIQEGGQGMAAYGEQVRAYGASLTHGPVQGDEDWTWQATLRIKPWESQ